MTARRTSEATEFVRDLSLDQIAAGMGDYLRLQAEHDKPWDVLTFEFWLAAMRDPSVRVRLAADWQSVRGALGAVLDQKLASEKLSVPLTGVELATIVQALGTGLIVQYYLDPEHVDPGLYSRALRRILDVAR